MYVAMVKLGAGGANFAKGRYSDVDFILQRLPIAQGNQFIQLFWILQKGVSCSKRSASQLSPLKRKIGSE